MRRAPIVLTATVAGLAGVLAFEPHEPTLSVAAGTGSSSAGTASGRGSASPTGGTTGSSTSGGATSSGTTASGAERSSSSPDSSGAKAGTYTGDAIDTQYGAAQVRVTISGGKITDVEALALQGNDPKSVQISSAAAPQLRQSALTKQSGDIDAVSGATITSASYEASLQSALDKAGFEAADGTRGSSQIPQVEEHHGGPDGGFGMP